MQSSTSVKTVAARDANAIETWLVSYVGELFARPSQQIDVGTRWSNLGFDSLSSVALIGALEEWLGRQLPVSLLRECTSIHALATRLPEVMDSLPPLPELAHVVVSEHAEDQHD